MHLAGGNHRGDAAAFQETQTSQLALIGIAALGIFNKLLGALFGFGKYLLITSVALYFFHKADAKFHWLKADTKAESVLYYRVLKVAPALWK